MDGHIQALAARRKELKRELAASAKNLKVEKQKRKSLVEAAKKLTQEELHRVLAARVMADASREAATAAAVVTAPAAPVVAAEN